MMISNSNEIYSDQFESEDKTILLVRQLDENDKSKGENVHNLEELLRRSRQLNSSKSLRLIDQQIENLPTNKNEKAESLVLSCNKLGKSNSIDWTQLPNQLKCLELSGNFVSSLNGIEKEKNQFESLGLGFNEINQIFEIFSQPKWSNLCLIDLSYNLLDDLNKTIQSLQNLNKLRILFLHGNPISLLVDYRVYVIDSLDKLNVLDDITITAEERFRSRYFSKSNQHPKDYSAFKITFGTILNVPMPLPSENEWPIQVHRYKMRIDWFEGENVDVHIPFDKMANFNRFNQTFLESTPSDYKPTIDFSPNYLDFSINQLIQFRDFLFHGTICRFIHQLTEYWPPGEPVEVNEGKKKTASTSEKDKDKDKKGESPAKKKKNEDISKLVTRKDPVETVLAEFFVDLRPFLDGDYQVSHSFKSILQQQIDSNNQLFNLNKTTKKTKEKTNNETTNDKKRQSSSKSNQQKTKDKKTVNDNDSVNELPPPPEPFQCSISFQLQRYVAQQQII